VRGSACRPAERLARLEGLAIGGCSIWNAKGAQSGCSRRENGRQPVDIHNWGTGAVICKT